MSEEAVAHVVDITLEYYCERFDKAERYRLLASIFTCVTTNTVVSPIQMGIV